jgi:hypothetical protein
MSDTSDLCHLNPQPDHVVFEQLLIAGFGEQFVRSHVKNSRPMLRKHGGGVQTPAAWAASAALRIVEGDDPTDSIADLGPLGVFCAALGAATLTASLAGRVRDCALEAFVSTGSDIDNAVEHLLVVGPAAVPALRVQLTALSDDALHAWTVTLLETLTACYRSIDREAVDDAHIASVLERFAKHAG